MTITSTSDVNAIETVTTPDAATVQFKLVKIQGDFIWHAHDDTDEVFIVY